jgi:hypothetical protein
VARARAASLVSRTFQSACEPAVKLRGACDLLASNLAQLALAAAAGTAGDAVRTVLVLIPLIDSLSLTRCAAAAGA